MASAWHKSWAMGGAPLIITIVIVTIITIIMTVIIISS